jgi:hypothetical protein
MIINAHLADANILQKPASASGAMKSIPDIGMLI